MTGTVTNADVDRLAKACETVARQWRQGHPPGHDAILELHRSLKISASGLTRQSLDLLAALKASFEEHLDMAALLDTWAQESIQGGWSTHQVDANRRRADQCRRFAADALMAIKKVVGPA